jgi:hypothetical protein
MIKPLNPQIAIIVLVTMTAILALPRVAGQAMPASARPSGTNADTGATTPSDKQEAKSASTGSSAWTAGATSFASPDKGAWSGGQSFSLTPKGAWTSGSGAFTQGAVQPRGFWRTRPSFSDPEGATSNTGTQAESTSDETVSPQLQPSAISASRLSKQPTRGASISGMGTHQSGLSSHQIALKHRQFGMPSQGRAGDKPAISISGQSRSSAVTRFGGAPSIRGSQSGSVDRGLHGATGLGNRPGVLGTGQRQYGLARSSVGRMGAGLDRNPGDLWHHSGQSKPQ